MPESNLIHEPAHIDLGQLAKLLTSHDASDVIEALFAKSGRETQTFFDQLEYHGLTGLVSSNISTKHHAWLASKKRLLVASEALRFQELERVFKAFNAAGISSYVVIKGTALAYSIYPHAWQRPRTDTDILIDQSEFKRVSSVLESLGYDRLFAISGRVISYQCSFAKALAGTASIMIDVHWKISNRQCLSSSVSLPSLLSRSTILENFASPPKIPSKAFCLLIACQHRLGHHYGEERLAWIYDIHLLSEHMSKVDWQQFTVLAISSQVSAICLDGVTTSTKYFGSSVPESVLGELKRGATRSEPSQILLRPNLSNWDMFKSDLVALNGIGLKWRFLIETAFPSPAYLKQKMGTSSLLKAFALRTWRGTVRLIRRH